MSKIAKLISELCPNGVEFKPLWSLTAWDKKFNGIDRTMQKKVISYKYYLSSEFDKVEREGGDVMYIATGITGNNRYTTAELAGDYLREGEIVCIPWGGTPNVKYFKGKFVTGDNRIATSLDTNILDNKFLYYWMQSKIDTIGSFYRGSGIQHPSMKEVLEMRVPVPHIAVQREIVQLLDKYTELTEELTTELTAELTARKQQYDYYTNLLLNFPDADYYQLGELCDIVDYRGKTPKKSNEGVFLVTAKNIRQGYIDYDKSQEYIPVETYESVMHKGLPQIGDVLITTEAPCGFVAQVDREDIALAQRVIKYRPKNNEFLDSTYLKYILLGREFQDKLEKASTGGTVKGIKGSTLHTMTIPVPDILLQKQVVNNLKRFDTLFNSISNKIPAEIEARKKQYDYYLVKLLSFEETETM